MFFVKHSHTYQTAQIDADLHNSNTMFNTERADKYAKRRRRVRRAATVGGTARKNTHTKRRRLARIGTTGVARPKECTKMYMTEVEQARSAKTRRYAPFG